MTFVFTSFTFLAIVAVVYGGYDYSGYEQDISGYGGYESESHDYDIGPIQVPLKEDGTPIDDEHVAAAKANHLAAHAQQLARLKAYKYGYATAQQDAPVETPEVQYARFQHLAAQEQAKQLQYNPQLVKSVLPVDAPEVQIAKKEHEARVEYIRNRNAYAAYNQHGGDYDQNQGYDGHH